MNYDRFEKLDSLKKIFSTSNENKITKSIKIQQYKITKEDFLLPKMNLSEYKKIIFENKK